MNRIKIVQFQIYLIDDYFSSNYTYYMGNQQTKKYLQDKNKYYEINSFLKSNLEGHLNIDLILNFKKIQGDDLQELCKGLEKCINVKTLMISLYSCNLSNQYLSSIANSFTNMVYLTHLKLRLGVNNIGQQGVEDLGRVLIKFQKLQSVELYFYSNKINDEGAYLLMNQLAQCQNISTLIIEFTNNKIGDQGILNIGQQLKRFTNLTTLMLYLIENQIEEVRKEYLETISMKLKKLVSFSIELISYE
ncbi:kinase domain protein (macronuclear) [Tetrahymena thermophila SB210]|uniref:Kinase domain protein n=1 Tax=Tetrahymena thermophila (strain SB210) TaxID=312017 RepID=W7X4F5_TETTS|nr:kinase domain protein [Tetrahymena thermophila SB210]EWS74205.1 kinase domain protein [Tetrahymena thermophila SB210]|eukprot:XP_012653265.1 kinase domain protein [Tetrahymena thermophila SB210]